MQILVDPWYQSLFSCHPRQPHSIMWIWIEPPYQGLTPCHRRRLRGVGRKVNAETPLCSGFVCVHGRHVVSGMWFVCWLSGDHPCGIRVFTGPATAGPVPVVDREGDDEISSGTFDI